MFNRNKLTNKKIMIKHNSFYKIDNLLLTPSFIAMLNIHNESKAMIDQLDYQDRITSYINRKFECDVRKEYNPKIVDLYENGSIIINKKEYPLRDFFIVFMEDKNDFHIKCINEEYDNTKHEYDKAVKFIDSTAFINLINNENTRISNNKLIIDNKDILNNIVKDWNGYLHSETKETDAIKSKKMIRDEDNG